METFEVRATWKSTHTMDVPEGMTREEAVAAYNDGHIDAFTEIQDIDSSVAELVDWEAS